MYYKRAFVSGLCLVVIVLLHAPAVNGAGRGVGLRTGLGLNPDQGVVGLQAVMGKTLKFARFAPSFDFGFGDDVQTFAFNGDIRLLLLTPPKSSTAFYGVAGPTVVYWNPDIGNGDTEIGLTLGAGIRIPFGRTNFYNLETRFGISDVPDVRILFGVIFGGGNSSAAKPGN